MKFKLLFFLLFICFASIVSQETKRTITATRINENIKIDGILNEQIWINAEVASQFIQLEPNPGKVSSEKTETRIAYDNQAIYISAILYENDPSKISEQLFERDQIDDDIETDWFGIAFDTYMDGINGFAFFISPSGVQKDMKFTSGGEDEGWDAVWESAVQFTEYGWVAEIKIPYSALRFPDKTEQEWHFQIARYIFRNQEQVFWNPLKPEIDGFFTQAGILKGISNISSPVRLSATPFLALYTENFYDKNQDPTSTWSRSFNGGMDVKYGLNDAFTLDMTLIPDFGQVQSDNEVLNLTPFEVKFDENRQFFTEGTELFSKAGLFYSRRVGGVPIYRSDVENQLSEGESIIENPLESQLINATKLSGRTTQGTGIGFFNAISNSEYAVIENQSGETRKVLTNPLTNYNVFVIDQNLPNNSYISFVNTNVLRSGTSYDANVTGTEFEFRNKANTYSFTGDFSVSQKYYSTETELGHKYYLEVGKRSGNTIWELGFKEESHKYDPNDLGFLLNNNKRLVRGFVEYKEYEPFGDFLQMGVGFLSRIAFLQKFPADKELQIRDNLFTDFAVNAWWLALTKSFWYWEVWTYCQPLSSYNYYEPRTVGRFYELPAYYNIGFNFNSDQRKSLTAHFGMRYEFIAEKGRHEKEFEFEPQYRVNDKLSLAYEIELLYRQNSAGYVTTWDADQIVFGKRNITDLVNIIKLNYIFNKEMSFNFRLRHNWTKVKYNSFHLLSLDGKLTPSDYNENENLNFNAFTIDATYRWRFAPGSDMFVVWKNAIFGLEETAEYGYFDNLGNLFDNPIRNSISVKLLYYIDYNRFTKRSLS